MERAGLVILNLHAHAVNFQRQTQVFFGAQKIDDVREDVGFIQRQHRRIVTDLLAHSHRKGVSAHQGQHRVGRVGFSKLRLQLVIHLIFDGGLTRVVEAL